MGSLQRLGLNRATRGRWGTFARLITLALIMAITVPAVNDLFAHSQAERAAAALRPISAPSVQQVESTADRMSDWQSLLLHIQIEAEHQAIDVFVSPGPSDESPIRTTFRLGSEAFVSADIPGLRRPPRA